MIGTVQSINPDAKRGTYDVTELVIINENGEEKTYGIFKNAPAHNTVIRLAKDDQVQIDFVKKGKFYNVDKVTKLDGATGYGNKAPAQTSPQQGKVDWDAKDAAIRRAVALKAAIELCAATATSKTDLNALAVQAVEIAPIFDPYLKGEEDPFEE